MPRLRNREDYSQVVVGMQLVAGIVVVAMFIGLLIAAIRTLVELFF